MLSHSLSLVLATTPNGHVHFIDGDAEAKGSAEFIWEETSAAPQAHALLHRDSSRLSF